VAPPAFLKIKMHVKISAGPENFSMDAPIGIVGIVGGGIGGSALALALQLRGIRVKIFESDVSFDSRRQGYGLTMQQAGQAMRALGMELEESAPSRSHYVFTSEGNIVGFFGRTFRTSKQTPTSVSEKKAKRLDREVWTPSPKLRFNVHIPRQVLRDMLVSKLQPGTIEWGRKVKKFFRTDGNGIVVDFLDGSQETVSALVGADGIHSVVRKQLIADDLCYLGVIVILGIVKSQHPLVQARIFETVDGTTRIYVMPFTADCSMWQLSFPCDEDFAKSIASDPNLLRQEAMNRCKEWHQPVPHLLASTTSELICGYPVYDREPLTKDQLRKEADFRVTLLGDAAHPMSPFRGQGANQALLDAVLLAECIGETLTTNGPSSLCDAFAKYEESMLMRSSSKVLGSREAASALHSTAVQKASETVDVCGHKMSSAGIIEELQRAGVGAWSSEEPEGLDAAVRRVAGTVPSGCPTALHVTKMLKGRCAAAAASADGGSAPETRQAGPRGGGSRSRRRETAAAAQ
jgi:2-polyprenyl-6-methoxyphenol hydroxylase-like FAD-dependent oxidoreductase